MPGKFEVYKDKAGEHRFRLKAANGQNILSSEGYQFKVRLYERDRIRQEEFAEPGAFRQEDDRIWQVPL